MDIKEYTRKTFPVNAVQVTLENIEQVADWCKGAIEQVETKMLGTVAMLPVIKLKGQGENRGKDFVATLGCYVVEFKGSFRVYKPVQFDASFEERVYQDEPGSNAEAKKFFTDEVQEEEKQPVEAPLREGGLELVAGENF